MIFLRDRSTAVVFEAEQVTSGLDEDEAKDASGAEGENGGKHGNVSEGHDHLEVVVEHLVLVSVQFLKLFQDDELFLLLLKGTLLFNGYGILLVGKVIFDLLSLNALRERLKLLLDLALVLHEVREESLGGDTTKLIGDVDLDDVLAEHLEVEVPPAEVHEGQAAVEELEGESLDDQAVLVAGLVLVVFAFSAPRGDVTEVTIEEHGQDNLGNTCERSHIRLRVEEGIRLG